MKLSLLLEAPGHPEGFAETDITDLVYDSRKAGPGCAFFCLRGSAADGHKYAPQAAKAGAAAVIAEEPVEAPGAQVILVPDTRKALALMSAAFFRRPAEGDITVIGVTGTKGKTTTAYMIASILEAAGHKTGVMGTIGVKIGDAPHPDGQHHPRQLRGPEVPAPDGGRGLRLLRDGGLLHRPEGPAGLRLPLRRGGVHQLLRGPHRRGGAQGYAGVHGEQGEALLHVQSGRGQRRRPQPARHPAGPYL